MDDDGDNMDALSQEPTGSDPWTLQRGDAGFRGAVMTGISFRLSSIASFSSGFESQRVSGPAMQHQ
jgi:hypothetical protein